MITNKFINDNLVLDQSIQHHALISITEYIKSLVGNVVFIDLQKAFDIVNREILCDKISYYCMVLKVYISQQLIRSILTNRRQYVSINGFIHKKKR